jgi:predicted outer membrane repeat protein
MTRTRIVLGLGIITSLLVTQGIAPGVGAAPPPTFSVNSTGDAHAGGDLSDGVCETAPGNGVCTLRAAVEKANAWPGGGAIIDFAGVAPPATYTLEFGALVISNTLTLDGAGASNTVIDGNGGVTNQRVMTIITDTVTISGVTITNGRETYTTINPNAFAGGILQGSGPLTLTNCIVSGNSALASTGAAYGGGIYSSGRLTLLQSSVTSNVVTTTVGGIASGGGIVGGFGLTVISSTISGNTARDSGGGIYGGGTLVDSTVSGNTAGTGGGINGGNLTLVNSTVSGNDAKNNGGGIYHTGSTAYLFNVTIADNTANAKLSGTGYGGGIYNASGTVNFQNSIVAANGYVSLFLGHPLFNPEDCWGTLSSLGYNIVSETADCTVNGSYTQAAPLLGPLQDNGGPTLTQALLAGSPAVDAGQPGNCTDELGAPITTDQRGFARPFGPRCDIGAFEYYPPQPPTQVTVGGPSTGVPGTAYPFVAQVGPPTATLPLSTTWQATGQAPVVHTGDLTTTDTISFTWSTTGTQVITVTASNVAGAVSGTHVIAIAQPERRTYVPLVLH